MGIFRRRKERREEKERHAEIEHTGVEMVDFETDKRTPLEVESYRGELTLKTPKSVIRASDKGRNVLKEFSQYFADPSIHSAEISRDDFVNLLLEVRETEEQKAYDKYFDIIQELIHALKEQGVKVNAIKGSSDSRKSVPKDDTTTTNDKEETVQRPDSREGQENPLHNSPE